MLDHRGLGKEDCTMARAEPLSNFNYDANVQTCQVGGHPSSLAGGGDPGAVEQSYKEGGRIMQFYIYIDIFTGLVTLAMVVAVVWLSERQIGQLRIQLLTQAKASQELMEAMIKTSMAALLPKIGDRFGSPVIRRAQQYLDEIYSETHKKCTGLDRASDAYKLEFRGEATKILEAWRQNQPLKYLELMEIGGFYDEVGLLCLRGYLHLEDVLDLYSLNIICAGVVLESHIKDRQKREQPTVYEHFLKLFGEAQKFTDYDPVSRQI